MSEQEGPSNPVDDLRRRAEELARQRAAQTPEALAALSPEEALALLHELQVHQIELEMQNEELRHAQEDLEASRERYFDLYDLAPVGYLTLSEAGLILEANLTAANLLGVARGALPRQPLARFILREDQDIYYHHRQTLLATRAPQECELRLLPKDGAPFWVHLRATAATDAGGAPQCRAVMSDISARKEAEAALRHAASEYRALAENLPDLIARFDAELRHVYVNPVAARVGVLSADQYLGKTIAETGVPAPVAEAWEERIRAVFVSGQPSEEDSEFVTPEGPRFYRTALVPERAADGSVRSVLSCAHDITERKRAEEAIAEAQKKYRALFETMSEGIVYEDHDGKIISANPAAERLLGLSLDQMQGRTSLDPRWKAIHEDGSPFPGETHSLHVAAKTGKAAIDEVMGIYNPKSDTYVWLSVNSTPEFLPGEKTPFRVYAVFRDITARKRAEAQLAKLEHQHRLVLDAAAEGILGLDLQGKHTFANPAAATMLGYEAEELLGRPSHSLWHHTRADGSAYPIAECKINETLQQGVAISLHSDLFWRKDGTSFPVEFSSTPVFEHGVRLGAVVTFVDITARRWAEGALRESEELYRTLVDGSDDTIHVKDRQRRYRLVNAHLAEQLGRGKADIVGKRAEDLYPPEVARNITAADERLLATGVSVEVEESLPWAGGQRVVLTRKAPLRNAQGEVSGIVTISRDITERKRLEAQFLQAQKMEAVGRLAGGVAHDFNNLLTVIQGRAEFAREALSAGHEAREDLTEVLSAAQRAASLTRQLLIFSRRQVVETRVFNLNEVLRDVSKMLARLIGENITLELKLADTLGNIKADAGQMEQVVMNLVVNARDAMPQGGTVTIGTSPALLDATFVAQHPDAQLGPHVLLSVSDTGCGMSQEVKERIFEPFFTTKDSGKGTGLGLATVYGIVKQSLGIIQVDSAVGLGTTFRLYLPCHAGAREAEVAPMAAAAFPRGTETILVVEDEEAVRQLAVRMLRSLGYRVLEAPRVEDVLYLVSIRNEPIQLVLSDVMMPEMSGPDLVRRLRDEQAKRGQAVRTPVLFMTGYTNEAIVALLPRGTNVLRKPFTTAQLALMVRAALDGEARETSVGNRGNV